MLVDPPTVLPRVTRTFASQYHDLVKNLLDISGAIVATAPTEADYHHEDLQAAFEKYLGSGGEDANGEDHVRLWHLIGDLAVDAKTAARPSWHYTPKVRWLRRK